jgi:hypothetical protein
VPDFHGVCSCRAGGSRFSFIHVGGEDDLVASNFSFMSILLIIGILDISEMIEFMSFRSWQPTALVRHSKNHILLLIHSRVDVPTCSVSEPQQHHSIIAVQKLNVSATDGLVVYCS